MAKDYQKGALNKTKDNRKMDEVQEKFQPKKRKAMRVSESFIRLSLYGRAERLHNCSTWLKFAECEKDGHKKLIGASFCRDRLCPMCNWRKSKTLAAQILEMLHVAVERRPMKFIFLTLTVRNVKAEGLSAELDTMFAGYKELLKNKAVDKAVVGWIRNLEITYNGDTDEYHPHFHVLIGVLPSYFDDKYISQKNWTSFWRRSCKLDYDPIIHVQRVKPKVEGQTYEAAVLETAKYSVKDSDYIKTSEEETDRIVSVFASVLKGRRLIGFGKLFKQIRAELKQQDIERDDADLVGADGTGCQCPICTSTLVEKLYSWDFIGRMYRGEKDNH